MKPKYSIGDEVWPVYHRYPHPCVFCDGEKVIVTPMGRADCMCSGRGLLGVQPMAPWWFVAKAAAPVTAVELEAARPGSIMSPATTEQVRYGLTGHYRIEEAFVFPTRAEAQAWCDAQNDRIAARLGMKRVGS
jgi:hypothetical protein